MANVKISQLTSASALTGTELFEAVQGAASRSVTPSQLKAYLEGASLSLTSRLTMVAGTTTLAPLVFTSGTSLTTPVAGAVEWNGVNLFVTQTAGPTRKTVAFTDSNISGTAGNVTGTVAVANGGTGATDSTTARANLGLVIGTNVQAWDADLDSIAGLAGTSGLLRKTAANNWTLDTNSYLTGNQSITLSGEVTGSGTTSISTSISAATITGKALTGYAVGTSAALAATDTILQAFGKVQAQINGLASGGSAITLTGDITGSGTGSVATTLATVNSNVGSYGGASSVPVLTVNAKGLVTAVSTSTVVAPAATLTGTTLASGVTSSSLTSVGTLGSLAVSGATIIGTDPGGTEALRVGGNVRATTFVGALSGNATTATALSSARTFAVTGDVTGSVSSDLTSGASISTAISAATVTGKALTGYSVGTSSALAATDTILQAFGKVQAQINGLSSGGGTVTLTGDVTGSGTGTVATTLSTVTVAKGGTGATDAATARNNLGVAIGTNVQAWDADLDAIAGLAGTSGLLKKTAANTWTLDTSTYLTANQSISVSGDVSGSGTTSIALTLATVNSNTGSFGGASTVPVITVNGKGLVTAVSTAAVVAPANTLSGTTLASGVTTSSLTSLGTLTALTVSGTTSIAPVIEKATVSATAATGTVNYDVVTQAVQYYTSTAAANWTVNFRGNSGTTLNSMLAVGQAVTVAFLVQQGNTAFYASAHTIDGVSVTPRWSGGSAPTAGNSNAVDVYTYTIIKTAATPTYSVFASMTKW